MAAVRRWFASILKWKRRQVTDDSTTRGTVAVVAATDVISDVSHQSAEDSAEAGFCGEPFADSGELLLSLSPLLFSMKLFGLYFHREDQHRRRTDDPEWNPATTTTRTSSSWLRGYATVVLVLMWLNVVRYAWVFVSSDHFGTVLFTKITVVMWFGLAAIYQTAYYYASHTGQLLEVLLTLPVTRDCVKIVRRAAIGITAFTWTTLIAIHAPISASLFFIIDGQYDFTLAPFVTYIEVPEGKILLARCVGILLYCWPIPCTVWPQVTSLVLVYVFYHQFRKLDGDFYRALGKGGQFNGDLSKFRQRHQTLSCAVNKVDGFMKFVNVAGFLCHIVVIIVVLYSLVFYPDSTETFTSTFINVAVLLANVTGLMHTASAGVIINHMVRKNGRPFCYKPTT